MASATQPRAAASSDHKPSFAPLSTNVAPPWQTEWNTERKICSVDLSSELGASRWIAVRISGTSGMNKRGTPALEEMLSAWSTRKKASIAALHGASDAV